MNARIRSAVLSVSERPHSIRRTRLGSPNAILPNLVGLKRVPSRKASTCDLNCCSNVIMTEC